MCKRRLAASLTLLLLLATAAPDRALAAAPQEGADPAKQIEKFERYLDRKPYHDWAFEQLMEAAVKANAVQSLVSRYEARVASAATKSDRVVHARLLARVDRVEEALELLRGIEEPPAALWQLVGALELRRGAPKAAVEALDRAVGATTDRQELEALHRLRGEAYLAAGESERAIGAYRDLAALAPEDFQLRLDVASALARQGLTEAALAEFDVAQSLAADDVARRCRVLSEIGRLHEQLGQGERALAVYAEALALMGRGNWLKRDLRERIIALHRRTKALDALVESTAKAAAATPGDLDAQEFHARALREVGKLNEAADVLARAATAHPSDVPLARARIEILREAGQTEAVIAEYQRILTERPSELDLYLELGQAFAASGQLEQAKRQWQKTLTERLDDPGLAARLAALYGLYGEVDDAVAMYEKALALEPAEVARYADLALYLKAVGRSEAIVALLERAEVAVGESPGKLDEIAILWRDFDAPERARATLERALALAPDDVKLIQRYADVQLAAGDLAGGTETLRRVLAMAADAPTRRTAVDRVIQAWWRGGREEDLVATTRASTTVADRLILGRLLVRRRDPAAALETYEALVAAAPELEEAREALAKLYEEAGELERALEVYDSLIEQRPQNRRKYLKDIAAIHLERFDQDAAFKCYDEILSSAPDNAAAFREVAKAYETLGLVDKAIECHLQALRLDPTDGRTRLELAELFRATGEWDRGEREIVAAFDAKDVNVQKRAREQYHALLAQEGRLAQEITQLRERIARNPYDTAAPVTLVDLYVRELEYELAIELLDELTAYQPSEPTLLKERARVLTALERHGEAVATYEELWKLPDADQRALALDIADAHIKRGDRARAEEVLTQLGDPDALARAYERNDLMNLAIETLEQSLLRRPNDQRLLDRLARLQERAMDRNGAIATVERLAALSGESWRTLTRLGTLYHGAGRREEALAIGERLFALVRIEEAPEQPKDDDEQSTLTKRSSAPPRLARSLGSGRSNAYDQRLDELRNWYNSIDGKAEFAEVAARELTKQPSNDRLLSLLYNVWSQEEGKGAQLAAAIAGVRAGTLDKGRTPPGVTRQQWQMTLDSYSGRTALKDSAYGRNRALELRAELSTGSTPEKVRELADLELDLSNNEAALEVLRAGVAAHPEDRFLLAGLASQLQRERKFEEALVHWRALHAVLVAAGETNANPADEVELAYRSNRTTTLRGFPIQMQRRLDDEALRRHYNLTRSARLLSGWTLGSASPTPGGVRLAIARCLHELGDHDGKRAELATLAAELGVGPEGDDPVAEPITALTTLANTYAGLDLRDEARQLCERLARIEAALDVHPIHGHNRSWEWTVRSGRMELAKILERSGESLEAYDVRRELGRVDECKLLLEEKQLHDAAVAFYEGRAAERTDDPSAWRDELVKLAEVHQFSRRFDAAQEVYRRIAERDPEDFIARMAVAQLHERAQRYDEAIAEHEAIIAAKRAANRRVSRLGEPAPPKLVPAEVPRAEGDTSWAWNNLRSSSRYSSSNQAGKHNVSEHYVAVLKLLLDQRKVERATELMVQIAREDARNMSWLSWSFTEIIGEYRLEADGVPLLRLLHSFDDRDEDLTLAYGNALMAAKRFDEARRIFRTFLERDAGQSYYADEMKRQLAAAEKRLGIDSTEDLSQLEAQVAADPKSAKARIALAQRLIKEKQDAAALEHALAAEELAPHLEEVRLLARRALQLNGRHEELEQRLMRRLDELKDDDELLAAGRQLATWSAERGDMAAVDAVWEKVRRKTGGKFNYRSPADWWAERGDYSRAIQEIELDLERADEWYKDDMRRKLASYRQQLGDPIAPLDTAWSDFEKLTARGDKTPIVSTLVAALLPHQHDPDALAAIEAAARQRGGLRSGLELAALCFVRGDSAAGEAQLHELARADREHAFLYPALVDLARGRKDSERALAYLLELQALGVASESAPVNTSIGMIAEADALRAEIGVLEHERGETAAAEAAWEAMFEPTEKARHNVFARLYKQVERWSDALAAQRRVIEESGARDTSTQRQLAEFLYESGEVAEALATYERLYLLVEGNDYERNEVGPRVMRLYRELGRLDERREKLRARVTTDPNDVLAGLELAQLEAEAGDTKAAAAHLERIAARPDQLNQVAPILIRAARERGDLTEAGRWYEALLAGNSEEWTRREHAQEYGKLLIEAGDLDRAIEVMLGTFPDPEGEEALQAIVGLLLEQRQYERALALHAQLTAIASKPEEHLAMKLSLLRSLGRQEEALAEVAAYLVDPELRKEWMYSEYQRADEEGRELARVTEQLEQAPEDPALALRYVALVRDKSEHAERSITLLERLTEAQPNDLELAELHARALVTAKRWGAAIPRLEDVLKRLDRDRARPDGDERWELDNRVVQLRQLHQEAVLEHEGLEALLDAQLGSLGLRYSDTSQRYYYTSNDVGLRRDHNRLSAYVRRGDDGALLTAFQALPAGQRLRTPSNVQQHVRALRHVDGDHAAVEEELFQRAFFAVKNPFSSQSQENYYWYTDEFGEMQYGSGQRNASVPPAAHELMRLMMQRGALEDLEPKLAALRAERPEDKSLEATEKLLETKLAALRGEETSTAEAQERKKVEVENAQEALAKDPHDPTLRLRLARILLRAGDGRGALEQLAAAEPMVRGRAFAGLSERTTIRRDSGVSGSVRFGFASSSGNSSSTSYSSWSHSSSSQWPELLRMRAAAHFAVGEREQGLEVEGLVTRLGTQSSDGWVYDPVTQSWTQGNPLVSLYLGFGLFDEANRIAESELQRIERECGDDTQLAQRRRSTLAQQFLGGLSANKEQPKRPELEERWRSIERERFAQEVAAKPDDLERKIAFAHWLATTAKDNDGAKALWAEVVAHPKWGERKPNISDAWLLLKFGDREAARATAEAARALRERQPSRAVADPIDVLLACTADELDEAGRALLWRALGGGQENPAIRAALGLPPRAGS